MKKIMVLAAVVLAAGAAAWWMIGSRTGQGPGAAERKAPRAGAEAAKPAAVSTAAEDAVVSPPAPSPAPSQPPAGGSPAPSAPIPTALAAGSVIVLTNEAPEFWIGLSSPQPTTQHAQPAIERTDDGYRISLTIPGFYVRRVSGGGEDFVRMEVPGWSSVRTDGEPQVPLKTILLGIPPGVEPVVELATASTFEVRKVNLWPAQPPPMDVTPEPPAPPFAKSAELYASAGPFPSQNLVRVSVERMRNRRLLALDIAPLQVSPSNETAVIAGQVDVTVTFAEPADSTSGERPSDEVLPEGFASGAPSTYMILMDDQFANSAVLGTFIDWKRRKGYDVRVVKTSDISSGGAPTHLQIQTYLRSLAASNYPEHLLIIGDHTAAQGVQGYYFTTYEGGWSDLYLANRTSTDYLPDLCHGRVPATNSAQLDIMLGKMLAMDRKPPTLPMYQRVCVAGQIQDADYNNTADRLFCETADSVACFFEQNAGGVDTICRRAMVNPQGMTAAGRWNPASILWNSTDAIGSRISTQFVSVATAQARISKLINSGLSLLQHRDHGYTGGYGWADPEYQTNHVAALTNGAALPAIFSINCTSGAYQHDRFLRAWLKNPKGGAYCVFAPVDSSYSWDNDWLTHGFYAAFLGNYVSWHNASVAPDWPKDLPDPGSVYGASGDATRLGQMLNFAKMYQYQNFYDSVYTLRLFRLFHCFGDPESFLHLLEPVTQAVAHPAAVAVGSSTITVTTGEKDSQVCLYGPALNVHAVALTGDAGAASFSVDLAATGTLFVTVTKYARRPYEGAIRVVTPQPPVITGRSPVSGVVCVGVNSNAVLAVTANDPDGGELAYEWKLNGAVQALAAASAWVFEARTNNLGPNHVEVIVRNAPSASTSAVWQVLCGEGDPTLISHWRLDGMSGADSSGWGNDLSLEGAVEVDVNGIEESAIRLERP